MRRSSPFFSVAPTPTPTRGWKTRRNACSSAWPPFGSSLVPFDSPFLPLSTEPQHIPKTRLSSAYHHGERTFGTLRAPLDLLGSLQRCHLPAPASPEGPRILHYPSEQGVHACCKASACREVPRANLSGQRHTLSSRASKRPAGTSAHPAR